MKSPRTTAVIVVLAGAGALAASGSGHPFAHAQDMPARSTRDRAPHFASTFMMTGGSELGVRVADAPSGGARIEEVEPRGAAGKAGLQRGDVVVEFDGERVRGARQFARLVRETPAGRDVKTTVVRDGKRQDIQVTPAEGSSADVERFGRPDAAEMRAFDRLGDLPFRFDFDLRGRMGARLGVDVDELTPQLAAYFGAKDGVLVTSVADDSAASRAGLKAGDVIASVNGSTVGSRADLVRMLRRADEEVTIGIVRERKESSVKVELDGPRRSRTERTVPAYP